MITPSPTTGTGVISCPTCATGSTSPGGSNTQLQYNNSGAFGGITGATSNGTIVTLTSPNFTTPHVTTILDGNGNPFILSSATTNAVDSITITNDSTANPANPRISASGSDSNINLNLTGKGSGTVIVTLASSAYFKLGDGPTSTDANLYMNKLNSGDSTRILMKQGDSFIWAMGSAGSNTFALHDAVAGVNVFTVNSNAGGVLNITASTFTLGGHTCSIVSTVLTCP